MIWTHSCLIALRNPSRETVLGSGIPSKNATASSVSSCVRVGAVTFGAGIGNRWRCSIALFFPVLVAACARRAIGVDELALGVAVVGELFCRYVPHGSKQQFGLLYE